MTSQITWPERFALGNDHFVVVVTSAPREFSVLERCLQGEGDNCKRFFLQN